MKRNKILLVQKMATDGKGVEAIFGSLAAIQTEERPSNKGMEGRENKILQRLTDALSQSTLNVVST